MGPAQTNSSYCGALHYRISLMPCHLISDPYEWINEISTVPIYYLTKPLSREQIGGHVEMTEDCSPKPPPKTLAHHISHNFPLPPITGPDHPHHFNSNHRPTHTKCCQDISSTTYEHTKPVLVLQQKGRRIRYRKLEILTTSSALNLYPTRASGQERPLTFILRAHQAGRGSLNAHGTKAPAAVCCSHLNAQFNHV